MISRVALFSAALFSAALLCGALFSAVPLCAALLRDALCSAAEAGPEGRCRR